MRADSRQPFGEQIATPGDVHEIGKSPGFPLRDLQSLLRQPIVAPPVVVGFVVKGDLQLLDQAVDEHPLDGAIESAWPEPELAAGERLDVLHDAVAVRVAVRQGEQDVKDRWRQDRGRLVLDRLLPYTLRIGYNHNGYTYPGLSWPVKRGRLVRDHSGRCNSDSSCRNSSSRRSLLRTKPA